MMKKYPNCEQMLKSMLKDANTNFFETYDKCL